MVVYMLIMSRSLDKRNGKEQQRARARGESSGSHMWMRDLFAARSSQVDEGAGCPFSIVVLWRESLVV